MGPDQRKKRAYLFANFFILFLFMCVGQTSLSAAQDAPKSKISHSYSKEETSILKAILSYLANNSFKPFITAESAEYGHIQFIKDEQQQIKYALGIIFLEDQSYYTLFSIEKTWFWNESYVNLLYMTTDTPIEPTLLNDILARASAFLPKDLSRFYLLIEKTNDSDASSPEREQKWIFFNKDEDFEMLVSLIEDGTGGTYFAIQLPN